MSRIQVSVWAETAMGAATNRVHNVLSGVRLDIHIVTGRCEIISQFCPTSDWFKLPLRHSGGSSLPVHSVSSHLVLC